MSRGGGSESEAFCVVQKHTWKHSTVRKNTVLGYTQYKGSTLQPPNRQRKMCNLRTGSTHIQTSMGVLWYGGCTMWESISRASNYRPSEGIWESHCSHVGDETMPAPCAATGCSSPPSPSLYAGSLSPAACCVLPCTQVVLLISCMPCLMC